MASFKILLVVALVAFIGSTDALKCMVKPASGDAVAIATDCDTDVWGQSCVIVAKMGLGGKKTLTPIVTSIEKQGCDAKNLGNLTKKFDQIPEKIEAGVFITFYCKAENCNMEKEIEGILKEDGPNTIEAMQKINEEAKGGDEGGDEGGDAEAEAEAETTVAVTDAFKCMVKPASGDAVAVGTECATDEKSCVIVAKISLEGSPLVKPKFDIVTKQACDTKDLGNLTKKFEIPTKIDAGDISGYGIDTITFYCKADECNVEKEIKDILKENAAKTIEAMKEANKAKNPEDDTAGAAQTTVAVATIALSMVMARLAL